MKQEVLDALRGTEESFQSSVFSFQETEKPEDNAVDGDNPSAPAGHLPLHRGGSEETPLNSPGGEADMEAPSALRAPPPEGEAAQRRLPLQGEARRTAEGVGPYGGEPAVSAVSGGDSSPCRGGENAARAELGLIRAHWEKLAAEAAGIEGFDLREALKDPAFVRLTAPGVGVSVEDAWYALHRRESMRRDEQAGRQRLAQAVAAACRRPKEGGGGASALIAADYRSLSRSEQLRVKKRIAEAASRGEKIYP